jgi:hypothetical protein
MMNDECGMMNRKAKWGEGSEECRMQNAECKRQNDE